MLAIRRLCAGLHVGGRPHPSIVCPESYNYERRPRQSNTWPNLNILCGIPEAADHGLEHVRSAPGKDFDTGHSIRDAKIAYFPSGVRIRLISRGTRDAIRAIMDWTIFLSY